jgi:hypothetical protein
MERGNSSRTAQGRFKALLLQGADLPHLAAKPATEEHLEAAVLKPAEDRAVFILSAAGKVSREAAEEASA